MKTSIRDLYTPEENQEYLERYFLGNMRKRTYQNNNWFFDFVGLLEDLNGRLGEDIREKGNIRDKTNDIYLLRIFNVKTIREKLKHYNEMLNYNPLEKDELTELGLLV